MVLVHKTPLNSKDFFLGVTCKGFDKTALIYLHPPAVLHRAVLLGKTVKSAVKLLLFIVGDHKKE